MASVADYLLKQAMGVQRVGRLLSAKNKAMPGYLADVFSGGTGAARPPVIDTADSALKTHLMRSVLKPDQKKAFGAMLNLTTTAQKFMPRGAVPDVMDGAAGMLPAMRRNLIDTRGGPGFDQFLSNSGL